MEVCVLKLKCLTNMQMGGGDVNYNVVDIEVEKDPVTGYPTMNASGVKGALREYFFQEVPGGAWPGYTGAGPEGG